MSAAWPTLDRAGALLGRARDAFGWWADGLRAWLPAGWRRALAASGERLWLQAEADGLRLCRQDAQGEQELARLPLPLPAASLGSDPLAGVLRETGARLPRWLRLPAAAGLRRPLLLPAAARERLHDVLGFEIERQTPFAAAEVVYAGRLLRSRADGQLEVELVVVPKARFDAALAVLGPLAGWLAGVDLDGGGRPLGVNLLPPAQRRRLGRPRWPLQLALAAAAALLLGLAGHQVLANRRAAADALQAALAARSGAARAAAAERQRLLDAVEGSAWLQARRNARPPAVEVLEELARRLPDGTFLEKLTIDNDQLTLIGLSNQAPALVGRLEGARLWRAPALSGTLQQDPRTRSDRFTLVAQLGDAAAPAAATGAAPGGPDGAR
ncbi:PilN domain-containing protein [Thermomonas flagellata]|uniref:PilN domain-containing protein n=1 Tax=Thermomonas flagellata TaxID=2888524 RepID=UPI001F04034B|nr:PilN domain-containing protein [Thermomonas flagellata]